MLAGKGIDELVVYPFFLFKGMHFSEDVPDIIESALEKLDKKITYKMLDPVGMHPDVFNIVQDTLYDEVIGQLEFRKTAPHEIEDKSMEIIENYLDEHIIPPDQKPIVKRVIHTTGDFDFLDSMIFHEEAVKEGLKAVREKKVIYTDVTMVQAGINKRFGHEVKCVLNDPGVVELAERKGLTKAAAGIRSLGRELNGNIVTIGNAPTALITLVDMIKNDKVRPALIVGIPVGFVNAKESKEYLTTLKDVPYITNRGHKGGSTVAAAIINALIKMEFINQQGVNTGERR